MKKKRCCATTTIITKKQSFKDRTEKKIFTVTIRCCQFPLFLSLCHRRNIPSFADNLYIFNDIISLKLQMNSLCKR